MEFSDQSPDKAIAWRIPALLYLTMVKFYLKTNETSPGAPTQVTTLALYANSVRVAIWAGSNLTCPEYCPKYAEINGNKDIDLHFEWTTDGDVYGNKTTIQIYVSKISFQKVFNDINRKTGTY